MVHDLYFSACVSLPVQHHLTVEPLVNLVTSCVAKCRPGLLTNNKLAKRKRERDRHGEGKVPVLYSARRKWRSKH
jgi:hypothetical protein